MSHSWMDHAWSNSLSLLASQADAQPRCCLGHSLDIKSIVIWGHIIDI
jgi:hypothetical protein